MVKNRGRQRVLVMKLTFSFSNASSKDISARKKDKVG